MRALHEIEPFAPTPLRLLFSLCFSPEEVTEMVEEMTGESAEGAREAVLMSRLVHLASTRLFVADALLVRLQVRLERPVYAGRTFVDLATEWSRLRRQLPRPGLAQLLFAVAREPSSVFRKLEKTIVDETEIRALRRLASPPGAPLPQVRRTSECERWPR